MELHFSAKTVRRNENGRTACASAAYRSGSIMIGNDGEIHDYTHREDYVTGGVLLPAGAPEELLDRQVLWSRHEAKDIRKDSQLYRDIDFSFPNEFSYETCQRVIHLLAQPLLDKGMCLQWDIHDKTVNGQRNLHAHLMITMRTLLADGTFGNKDRSWNKYNGGLNIAEELRPEVARIMNEELEAMGLPERVEHESFAKRGIDRIPTTHVGAIATRIVERGGTAYRKAMNVAIKELNSEHLTYLKRIEELRTRRAIIEHNLFADVANRSLEDMMAASRSEKEYQVEQRASNAELREQIDEHYRTIREAGAQIYDLRKEKKQVDNLRYALQLFKNLHGDQNLTEDQKQKLAWATGYLRWATGNEPSMSDVVEQIEHVRELNTERCIALSKAVQRRDQAYSSIDELRKEIKENSKEKWLQSRGVYR